MEAAKIEDTKEEKIDIESLSIAIAGSDSENKEPIRCNIPVKEAGLESIKYEQKIKKEENNCYGTEMSIKTENIDIKDEVAVEEHELSYEQLKSIITDDHKIDCSNEYLQHRTSQCYVLSNKLEENHGQYLNYLETLKHEQNVEKEDTCDDIEEDMEKQNAVWKYQHNSFKYETRDTARHSNNKTNTELSQPLLPVYKAKNKSASQTDIKVTLEADAIYLKCQFCEYITKYLNALKMHFTTKHSENAELYQCFSCKYKTKVKSRLVQHCKLQHNKRTKWHQCHYCNFKTKHKESLSQHHNTKHYDAAEIFHCDRCDFKTKHKVSLFRHHRIKHDDAAEIFHCERCNYKTKMRSFLLRHHRVKHGAAEMFHCQMCDFKTKYKTSVLQHHRSKHAHAVELFYCMFCDYVTRDKECLSQHHISKHNDAAEIFHCELCEYKTKIRRYLRKHHKSKHDDTCAVLHCEQCDFKTKYKNSLLTHTLKHDAVA